MVCVFVLFWYVIVLIGVLCVGVIWVVGLVGWCFVVVVGWCGVLDCVEDWM